jgi:NADPH:quinone reductase-like Zn-dependent oxidoreductase
MPKNRAAWITEARSKRLVVQEAPFPTPGKDEIVVKNTCVAINPVDYKIQDWDFMNMQYPAVLGCEVAGEIVAVGDQVRSFQIGQRVIGFVSSQS